MVSRALRPPQPTLFSAQATPGGSGALLRAGLGPAPRVPLKAAELGVPGARQKLSSIFKNLFLSDQSFCIWVPKISYQNK